MPTSQSQVDKLYQDYSGAAHAHDSLLAVYNAEKRRNAELERNYKSDDPQYMAIRNQLYAGFLESKNRLAQLQRDATSARATAEALKAKWLAAKGQHEKQVATSSSAKIGKPVPDSPAVPAKPSAAASNAAVPVLDANAAATAADSKDNIVDGGETKAMAASQPRADHRIRLSAFSRTNQSLKEQIYGKQERGNLLYPLWETDGLMFPYTPTIQVSQDTTWQAADIEQSNFDILSWKNSSSATISITAKFTVQNQREGEYLLAAIHFLRTVSKSFFGEQDAEKFAAFKASTPGSTSEKTPQQNADDQVTQSASAGRAGLPPPVLLFSGYGDYMFNDLRVVVKSHSWSYDEAADLIRIDLPHGKVWLPPMMTVSITLALQANTDRVREQFNLDDFRTGILLKKGGWF